MTKLSTLSAVMILAATVATPAFARPIHHTRAHSDFRGAYNQMIEPSYAVPQTQSERTLDNFGFSRRDPSRVGGFDPNLNPSGS